MPLLNTYVTLTVNITEEIVNDIPEDVQQDQDESFTSLGLTSALHPET